MSYQTNNQDLSQLLRMITTIMVAALAILLVGLFILTGVYLLTELPAISLPSFSWGEETTPGEQGGPAEPPADDGVTLAATPDAGIAYQDKIIFVGDSLTAHLINRGVLTGGTATQQVWRCENNMMNLNSEVVNAKIIYPATGEKMTIAEAAAKAKPEIMIITLGTDYGVSYLSEADFKACYTNLIKGIQKASPRTTIILQSIFPVTATCTNLNNPKIDTCNTWVKAIAAENGCYYLNTQTVLKDSNNCLKAEYCNSTDGIHMGKNAYEVILQYIRTHAVPD
jgi:hypothetical protein